MSGDESRPHRHTPMVSSSEDKTITDRYQDKLGSNGESCTSTVKSPGTVAHALAPAPWMDSTRFEAFEYKELADVAKKMERIFDDLTGVSPLWFGVEGDETSGSNSFGKGGQRGGNIMFGDWQLDESMLEVFENQIEPTRSNKQQILKAVDALLSMCDENGVKERQGLEACALAFKKYTEGDLDKRLDTLLEQCTQRWVEEQEKTEAAQTGLVEVDAQTASRLAGLAQGLKDRQETVLADMRREREANKRKILASTVSDPHEDDRELFNKQLELTDLEGKVKQRQRLLDITVNGTQLKQEEIEGAMIKAARDKVENLMQVVDKMQTQQTTLSVTLQGEKRKIGTIRANISKRLGISAEETGKVLATQSNATAGATKKKTVAHVAIATTIATASATGATPPGNKAQTHGEETKRKTDTAEATGKNATQQQPILGQRGRVGEAPRAEQTPLLVARDSDGGDDGVLEGAELLDACDRLEDDNLRLRQRLAKLELEKLQKEHDDEEKSDKKDPRLARVLERKKNLQEKLEGLRTANTERERDLKRKRARTEVPSVDDNESAATQGRPEPRDKGFKLLKGKEAADEHEADIKTEVKVLERKTTCLRRQLVFALACKVMRRKFDEAGLGPGNDPAPPSGLSAIDESDLEAEDSHGVPRDMRAHAMLLQQRQAVQREIDGTEIVEKQLARALTQEVGGASGDMGNSVDNQESKENTIDTEAIDANGVVDGRNEEECWEGTDDGEQAILGEKHKSKGVTETADAGRRGGGGDKLGAVLNGAATTLSDERCDPPGALPDVVAITADDSPSLSNMKRISRMVRLKLAALRGLAAMTKEAELKEEGIDKLDRDSLEAVLRNEEIVKEKAGAVLSILRSSEMKQASARWLKEAIERSLTGQTEDEKGNSQPDTAKSSANDEEQGGEPLAMCKGDSGPPNTDNEKAEGESGGASVAARKDDAAEGQGGTSDGVVGAGDATDVQPTTDSEKNAEAIEAKDGASEGGGGTWGDDEETKYGMSEREKEGRGDDEETKGDTSGRENIEREDDSEEEKEEATVVGESEETEPAAATPTATATAGADAELQKQDMEARAREAEKCNELVEARAAKKKIITELRAKIAAAGGGRTRSMSRELRKREVARATKSAQKASDSQQEKKKLVSTMGIKDPALSDLPIETKREISSLRRQETSLAKNYEQCLERIRKLMRIKGMVPDNVIRLEESEDGDVDNGHTEDDRKPKPRKLTSRELEKKKYLNSLTPQLKRWRSRVVAMTRVLEEAQAQREVAAQSGERSALEAGASSMILLTSAAAGTEAGAAPPMCPSALSPNTVLPMARVSLDLLPPHVVASSGSGEGRSLSPDSGRAYSGRGDSPEQHRQSIGKVGGWLPKGDFILGGGRGMGLGGSRGEKGGSSTAIGTTTTEMATGDGARSAGRVLKEARKLRGRMESAHSWLGHTKSATKATRIPPSTSSGKTVGTTTAAGVDAPSSTLPPLSLWPPNDRPVATYPQNMLTHQHHHRRQDQAPSLLTSTLDLSTGSRQNDVKRTERALPLSQSPPGNPSRANYLPPRQPIPPKVERGQPKQTVQAPGGHHQRHRTVFQVFGAVAPNQPSPAPRTVDFASSSRSRENTDDAEGSDAMIVGSDEKPGVSASTPMPPQYFSSAPDRSPQQQQREQITPLSPVNIAKKQQQAANAEALVDGVAVHLGSPPSVESEINATHRLIKYNGLGKSKQQHQQHTKYYAQGAHTSPSSPWMTSPRFSSCMTPLLQQRQDHPRSQLPTLPNHHRRDATQIGGHRGDPALSAVREDETFRRKTRTPRQEPYSRHRYEGSSLAPTSSERLQPLPPSVPVNPLVLLGEAMDIPTTPLSTSPQAKRGEARPWTPTPGKVDCRHLPDRVNNPETTGATQPCDELDVNAGDDSGIQPPPARMVSPDRARAIAGGDPDIWARREQVPGASSETDGAVAGGPTDDFVRDRREDFSGIVYQQHPQRQHGGHSYGGGSATRGWSVVSERKGDLGAKVDAETLTHIDSTSFGGSLGCGREQQVIEQPLSPRPPWEGIAAAGATGPVMRFGTLPSSTRVADGEVTRPEALALVPSPRRLRALLGTTNNTSEIWPYQRTSLPLSTSSPPSLTGRLPSSSAVSLLSVPSLSVTSASSGIEAPPPPDEKNRAHVGGAGVVVGESDVPRAQQEDLAPTSSRRYSTNLSTSSPAVVAAQGGTMTIGAEEFRTMQHSVVLRRERPRQAATTLTKALLTNFPMFSLGESPLQMVGGHPKPGDENGNNGDIEHETSTELRLSGRGGARCGRRGRRRREPTVLTLTPYLRRKVTPDTMSKAVVVTTLPLPYSKTPRPPLVGLLTTIRTNNHDCNRGICKGGDVRNSGWSRLRGDDHGISQKDGETRAARGTHEHTEKWTRAEIPPSFVHRKQSIRSISPLLTPGAWTPAADGDHWPRFTGGPRGEMEERVVPADDRDVIVRGM